MTVSNGNASAIYKVGDKAVVVSTEGASMTCSSVGTHVQIIGRTGVDRYKVLYTADDGDEGVCGYISGANLQLINAKPTKNQRISALESEVSAVKAEVEALKQAQGKSYTIGVDWAAPRKKPAPTPNELRKAVIAEARAFVADNLAKNHPDVVTTTRPGVWVVREPGVIVTDKVEFSVNAEKRTVVALVRDIRYARKLSAKAIAKCAPGDVFNADIGKAIALGRALGLDVSKFEQAVQPTEFAVGQRVLRKSFGGDVIDTVRFVNSRNNSPDEYEVITDDTEAQYE